MNIAGKKQADNMKSSNVKIFLLLTSFLFILIVSVSFISAIQIEMNEEFSQDETLMAKITGNFVDALTSNNIFFYREHVRVPTQFSLEKVESDYYLYALLSNKNAGNYSIQIQNLRYKIGTQVKDDDVIKNFTITEEIADFYVVPGFVRTEDDFSLELTNLRDGSLEVEITFGNYSSGDGFFESFFGSGSEDSTQTVSLSSGQTKKVDLQFDDSLTESTFKTIFLESENTSYSVPVYMETENTTTNSGEIGKLKFTPPSLNVSMATGSNKTRIIYLTNVENASVEDISLYVSESLEPYVELSISEIDELEENSSIKIELTILSGEDEDNIEGQVTARYASEEGFDDEFAHLALFLGFIKDYVPSGDEGTTGVNIETCSELNAFKCSETETCSEENIVQGFDGACCLIQCTAKPESGSTGKIIGWGLAALVVAFLIWFFLKKYKKVSNPVDLLKIASGKK